MTLTMPRPRPRSASWSCCSTFGAVPRPAVVRDLYRDHLSGDHYGQAEAAVLLAAATMADVSAIDGPVRVLGPGSRADNVLHESERLTDGHGVVVQVLVVLPAGQNEPLA